MPNDNTTHIMLFFCWREKGGINSSRDGRQNLTRFRGENDAKRKGILNVMPKDKMQTHVKDSRYDIYSVTFLLPLQ